MQLLTDPQTGRQMRLLIAYASDDRREVVAYGFDVSGIGFWARISGVLAVTPDLAKIKGIYFLKHSETPGLGGRITEDEFRRQFRGRDITPPRKGKKYIYVGGEAPAGPGDEKYGRRVDAITGATGTSNAVDAFLNESIARFRRAMIVSGRLSDG